MKTAIEIAEKEIAELWSSPSDHPTYTQIFEVLERVKETEKQQIIDAVKYGQNNHSISISHEEKMANDYYNSTFATNKETLK